MTNKTKAQQAPPAETSVALTEAVVVQIDGNSISALSGRQHDGICHVDAIEHIELDELVEVTKHLHHPVFMDTYFRYLAGKEVIARILEQIFRNPIFQRPTVALLSPEEIAVAELNGPVAFKSKKARQAKLVQQLLPLNPYDYPCAIRMEEVDIGPHNSTTRITRVRLADLLPLNKAIAPHGPSYHGAVLGLNAAANIIRLLATQTPDSPATLCDVGKLRTLYSTALPDGRVLHNAIPVGLAGDLMNSARTYVPTVDYLLKLEKTMGVLLLSPETSTSFPSDTSKSGARSPQIDCTRFASQIARYHARSFLAHAKEHPNDNGDQPDGIHYISGRGSRLPGLRPFVEAVIGAPLRRVDRRPVPGIVLAPTLKWSDMADNLLLLGALLEATRPGGFMLHAGESEFQTVRPSAQKTSSIGALEEERLYVFEQKLDIVSA